MDACGFENDDQVFRSNLRALKDVFPNYKQKVSSKSEFFAQFPYLSLVMQKHGMTPQIIEAFSFTSREERQIADFMDAVRELGAFNPAAVCYTSGLTPLYNFFLMHKDRLKEMLVEEGLWDNATDAVYLIRYEGMHPNHRKVGVGNFNHIWTRQKVLRDEFSKRHFFNSDEERLAFRDERMTIVDLEVIYVPGQAREIEARFMDTFERADMTYFTASTHAADEFICIDRFKEATQSGHARLHFEEMIDNIKAVSETYTRPIQGVAQDPLHLIPATSAYAAELRPLRVIEIPVSLRGFVEEDDRQMDLFD